MATATLIPSKYWQCDYGYITAMNPETLYLKSANVDYATPALADQRAAFLEFVIPADAVYRHAVITKMLCLMTQNVSTYNYGMSIYGNEEVDLNLALGVNVSSAGNRYIGDMRPNVSTNEGAKFLRAKNGKIYIGCTCRGVRGAQDTFNAFQFDITYEDGDFAVTPSISGGYIPTAVDSSIRLTSAYIATMIMQYTVSSGVFYYKKASASNYSSISFTGDTVTIPANTFEEDEEYNYYFTAVSDDGKTASTEVYTVSTGDAVGTVTALSPNNMVAYGTPTFTWLYENELGNLQTAFDLQISADQAVWSDIAIHHESAETAYTVSVPVGGNLYWRVRAYNHGDVASEWSNVLPFSNILPPSPPTITGVSGAGRITVAWNSANQIAYQVMVGEHDSGWVYSSQKSYFLNDYLPDGSYEIKVRVTNGIGLASDWATMTYTQSGSVAGPSVSVEMKEGFNEITISGAFDKYYIIRNGVVIAQTTAGTYSDYFCNGTDNYVIRGVNADDTFGDSVLTGRYTCRKPALIARDNSILYINERLDEEPHISASNTLAVVAAEYLGRTKPVHHVGQMNTRTWSVSCSRSPIPGEIYFYRNFRGDKAWVICSNVQSTLNSIGVHEYQFTLEETDYKEAVDYEV